jgi:hypothetical protein
MQSDRWFSAFGGLVERVLNDKQRIDYRALYPARVIQWNESGINPSGLVDVVFINDDLGQSATKLRSKAGIPVLPTTPGLSYKPTAGTQVLVGWQGGDERYPYALAWLGLGGSSEVTQTASDAVTVTASTPVTGHVDVVASTVNLGDAAGGQTLANQTMVTATSTMLGVQAGYFSAAATAWAQLNVLIPDPTFSAAAAAATAAATATTTWSASIANYTTNKTKAT